ncbi:hypothetical protein XENTR_v10003678 [Xenopus tropicalis]|uniref:Endoplasmic reticulum membrane sensor NFE2L1 n=1 Tax=Xenopus tropicalis TaxID=8364 RepID=F6QIQ6_XENTR|nr:endoplasmic reticulum membrane sensor NFE2L1 isoform X1 [Xenopus tropicalis]XP_012808268.2 endoplasmic reticulum membrane sensor NFE2L1 isoform X1 [Xenopus tropicalis]KAE8575044.1 hypothetical protein XENTR_v10003678 [Xenopus tropicalis]KAE8575045.1 hypothetical protein XENTR_v10003678 [Xenopus tropicalis]
MLSLKKYLTEGLIQFTILLSLMGVRLDLDSYLPSHLPPLHEIILGPTSAYTQTQFHSLRGTSDGYGVHPKSVDLDQFFTSRRLLGCVRALDRLTVPSTEVDAWLVHRETEGSVSSAQTGSSRPSDSPQDLNSSGSEPNRDGQGLEELGATAQPGSSDLSKEDIDLIDILWRQDIDLGVGREDFENRQQHNENEEVWESLRDGHESEPLEPALQVDGETGESIPQDQTALSLEECLSLLDVTFPFGDSPEFPASNTSSLVDAEQCPMVSDGTDRLLSPLLPDMRASLDLEEQWQDLMSLMETQAMEVNNSAEDPLYLSLDPPLQQDVNLDQASLPGCSHNASSLFTPILEPFSASESPVPQLSSHNSTDLNSTFGFTNLTGILFPSQLNNTGNITSPTTMPDPLCGLLDEALLDEISLMELALEEGFSQVQASQLQEELDSDSGLSLDSHHSPLSPSGSESSSSSSCSSSSSSSSSFSEEGAVGYSSDSEMIEHEESEGASGYQPQYSKFCRMSSQDPSRFRHLPFLEHVGHNHTYNMVPEEPEEVQPVVERSVRRQSGFLERQAGRDDQRARSMKIPFSNDKIINLPVEEFNELLAKYQLSESQLCLIRDIRRRGKNKMAAQNCRKRKLDTILNLEQEVKRLNRERSSQLREKGENLRSLQRMKEEVEHLYQEVFSQLRDQNGRPYSPQQYALHYTSNGSIILSPRTAEGQQGRRPERKDRRK